MDDIASPPTRRGPMKKDRVLDELTARLAVRRSQSITLDLAYRRLAVLISRHSEPFERIRLAA